MQFTTLEELIKLRTFILDKELEDEVFEKIEAFELRAETTKAANLLSIYVNFVIPRFHRILMNSNRACVALLIKHELLGFEYANKDESAMYISKITKSGIQHVSNYTIYQLYQS